MIERAASSHRGGIDRRLVAKADGETGSKD
jgi:hypothetical protein